MTLSAPLTYGMRVQEFDHIDCLINNAGVFAGRQRELTKEGYELTYGINVQALYLVTCLLLSKVKRRRRQQQSMSRQRIQVYNACYCCRCVGRRRMCA